MATQAFIGDNLVVKINAGSGKQTIAYSQDCKLTIDSGMAKATTKDSNGWEESIAGNNKWSISTNGLQEWTPSVNTYNITELATVILSKTLVTVYFEMPGTVGAGSLTFSGSAYITKVETDAKQAEAVTYSVELEGTGQLVMIQN